jgi:SUMO ligase MMS21 Smc5/6 complex component
MTFEELEIEIDFIMNLSEENLKETSTEDLLNYRKKLKRNCEKIKNLRELKNNRIIDFNANNRIIKVEEKIENIDELLERFSRKEKGNLSTKEDKKSFTLNQKFELLKKIGYLDLIVNKFDVKIQHQIFSELFDCNIDTSRKIHSGTYKKTTFVRPNEYKELLKKINKE